MSVFSPVGSSSVSTTLAGAQTPTIVNVAMASANTEYSYTLPANTKKFLIKTRAGAEIKLSYSVGTSGTTYITVPRYNWYSEAELTLGGVTLYFQSTSAAQIAEIVSWV